MSEPRISWVILTHNRSEIVRQSFTHNITTAGRPFHEIVWCDNGSSEWDLYNLEGCIGPHAETTILNSTNLGVARGYNRAHALTTGTHIVITGCDTLMPDNWLATFVQYHEAIPGIACVYTKPLDMVPERVRGPIDIRDGLPFTPAMPVERRFLSRDLFSEIGYFPEDFGLYGYDDLAWAARAEQVCYRRGVKTYVLPKLARHLDAEGIDPVTPGDTYHEMKRREIDDRRKKDVLEHRRRSGWPRCSPFP